MKPLRLDPLATGPIHFVGIGGIGMSGIAEVLVSTGFTVQGSDLSENANVLRLRRLGCEVKIGHDAANLGEARVIVVSSAVKPGNPELEAARAKRLPVVRRADMLAELMRLKRSIAIAGTHGKTTTTSIVAALLDAAGYDPTVINGGIINAYGTNARVGSSDWMAVEADESDGSFLRLPATIGVVLNIDPEHMEHYGDFDAVRAAYESFLERLPFYGFGVLCVDHPEVQALLAKVRDRRLVTYGFSQQADVQGLNVDLDAKGSTFDARVRDRVTGEERAIERLSLAMPGRHNVSNALAAVAIAAELNVGEAALRRALEGLKGVKRRFTITGEVGGITVVDDYGHHPVEIRAVLATARAATQGRVIAVVQPHRYSRLQALFGDFCQAFADADAVLVAPVHAAGEAPIEGCDHRALVKGLLAHGQREVSAIDGPDELPGAVDAIAEPGDMVVCLGAGSVTAWAGALPAQLSRLRGLDAA